MASYKAFKPSEKYRPFYEGGEITPPKFTPTYMEYLRFTGVKIMKWASVTANSGVYAVPVGYTFFLDHIDVNLESTAAANFFYVYVDNIAGEILYYYSGVAASEARYDHISYPFPYIVNGGQEIRCQPDAGDRIRVFIYGTLVKNENLTTF